MNNEFINEYDVNNDDNNDDMNNNSSNNNSNENENKKNENDPTNILSFIRSLPVYRGKLPIGCSRRHLTYHVGISYSHKSDRKTLIELALRTSRIACIAADISRGRPISSAKWHSF